MDRSGLCFRKRFWGGHPRGSNFRVAIGNRTAKGKEEFRKYHAAAINVPGLCPATRNKPFKTGATGGRYGGRRDLGFEKVQGPVGTITEGENSAREAATTEVDTGIEGILNQLEKQRNLTLWFVLRDKEDSTGLANNDNKHDQCPDTSTGAVSMLYLS